MVVDAALREDTQPEEWQDADPQRRLPLDRLQAVLHAQGLLAELGGGDVVYSGTLVRLRPRVTRRRSSYRSLTRSSATTAPAEPASRPGIRWSHSPSSRDGAGQRAYLFGQAPGVQEGDERRPWRGRAGRTLRRWLELDEDEFYATFYCASVTRCYPGRAASGHGDRTPDLAEQALCAPSGATASSELLRPALVVAVGGLAIRRLLGERTLDCIGGTSSSARRRQSRSRIRPVRAGG